MIPSIAFYLPAAKGQTIVSYVRLPVLEESGYVVLDRYDQTADPQEWVDVEYVGWKSSGASRFAPLASAYGDLECDGLSLIHI